MKSTLIAVALAPTAIVLAGFTCVMSNGQINPSNNLCNQAFGTPLPDIKAGGKVGVCCIFDSQPEYIARFEKGCADNNGKVGKDNGC